MAHNAKRSKRTGARVKRKLQNGNWLYEYREYHRGPYLARVGPGGDENHERFDRYVLTCWDQGRTPDEPSVYLAAPVTIAAPSHDSTMTLESWVGDPALGQPGEFFASRKRRRMSIGQRFSYETCVRLEVPETLRRRPMNLITAGDAEAVLDDMVQCASCTARAERLGLALPPSALRTDDAPFDGMCSAHWPDRVRSPASAQAKLTLLRALYRDAIAAGHATTNPFEGCSIGDWTPPPTNRTARRALSIVEFERLVQAHPAGLRVIAVLSAFAMLRRGEFFGLRRCDVPTPPEDPADDPESLTFELAVTWSVPYARYQNRGKTTTSTHTPITLTGWPVKVLNDHLRSDIHIDRDCPACRVGHLLWRRTEPNPHNGCGFADNAPLVPARLCRPQDYRSVGKQAFSGAGLDHDLDFVVTHQVYRSTGATMLVAAGVPIDVVTEMGRWSSPNVVRDHYVRLYPEARIEAGRRLDQKRRTTLGHDDPDPSRPEDRIAALEAQVELLTADNRQLRAAAAQAEAAGSPITAQPRWRSPGERASKWRDIPPETLKATLSSKSNRKQMLETLGFSLAAKNYAQLEAMARQLNITLPRKWPGNPPKDAAAA
ncbi:MAG: hypothetical protein KDD84_16095 [Caldilineaceae bacterium]|nr:hypothetical protein [Caldilineaceae bacterium]